jgi:hypothetical protein
MCAGCHRAAQLGRHRRPPGGVGSSARAYPTSVLRVLITGVWGVGKSTLVEELRQRGYTVYDADDDGFTEPRRHGRWGWRSGPVQDLLHRSSDPVLFLSGCSEEQARFHFDLPVLLSAPSTSSSSGSGPAQRTPTARRLENWIASCRIGRRWSPSFAEVRPRRRHLHAAPRTPGLRAVRPAVSLGTWDRCGTSSTDPKGS